MSAKTKSAKSSSADASQPVASSQQFKHSVVDVPGPAFELITPGSSSASHSDITAACLLWRSEVARTGATLQVAHKAHEFATRMCTEAIKRAFVRKAGDSHPPKRARTTKADGKGQRKSEADCRVDSMEEDEVTVLDAEVEAESEEWVDEE